MVDVKTQTKPVNPRTAIRERRQRRLRLVSEGKNATVKVWAANEAMREVLRHPSGLIRFRDKLDQPVEWPHDSFTARRIADGSVLTEAPSSSGDEAPVDESLNPREQSAARKAQSTKAEKTEPAKRESAKREQQTPQPAA
jgi:hypothetical protein